jgi:hypothetical protein
VGHQPTRLSTAPHASAPPSTKDPVRSRPVSSPRARSRGVKPNPSAPARPQPSARAPRAPSATVSFRISVGPAMPARYDLDGPAPTGPRSFGQSGRCAAGRTRRMRTTRRGSCSTVTATQSPPAHRPVPACPGSSPRSPLARRGRTPGAQRTRCLARHGVRSAAPERHRHRDHDRAAGEPTGSTTPELPPFNRHDPLAVPHASTRPACSRTLTARAPFLIFRAMITNALRPLSAHRGIAIRPRPLIVGVLGCEAVADQAVPPRREATTESKCAVSGIID